MARNYDSSRRKEAAQQTREAIIAAAFKLHGIGVMDLESLAREANVSLATVRKHFPNREELFSGCVRFGLDQAMLPDLALVAAIEDPAERLREAVRQAYAFHESLFGQVWQGYKLEGNSAVMDETLAAVMENVAALAENVAFYWPGIGGRRAELAGLMTGLLSPLTYRGLRVHGKLVPESAVSEVCALLLPAFWAAEQESREGVANR